MTLCISNDTMHKWWHELHSTIDARRRRNSLTCSRVVLCRHRTTLTSSNGTSRRRTAQKTKYMNNCVTPFPQISAFRDLSSNLMYRPQAFPDINEKRNPLYALTSEINLKPVNWSMQEQIWAQTSIWHTAARLMTTTIASLECLIFHGSQASFVIKKKLHPVHWYDSYIRSQNCYNLTLLSLCHCTDVQ